MTTTIIIANQQALSAQIATLDYQIAQLTKLINASSLDTGSLMLIGRSGTLRKHMNELIVWRDHIPFPTRLIKDFLQHYANHLIYQRNNCVKVLQSGQTEMDFNDCSKVAHCDSCCRQTLQRNYFVVTGSIGLAIPAPDNTWICNECENIIKEDQP